MSSEESGAPTKSIILVLLRNDELIPTCYIQDCNLAEKFIESLKTLIPNENAVDRIVASEEIVNLFSMLDNDSNFTSAKVEIKELEPNSFTIVGIRGSSAAERDVPIVFTKVEYKMTQHPQEAAVFDASDTFLNRFVTHLVTLYYENRIENEYGFMCTLVRMNRVQVLRMLLERNVDVERSSNEPTPFQLACLLGREEIVAMFVYHNVPPFLPAVRDKGTTYHSHPPVFYAVKSDMGADTLGMLIDYTFDQWSHFDVEFLLQLVYKGSAMNCDRALELLAPTMPLFYASQWAFSNFWSRLFTVPKCRLQRALEFLRTYRSACDALMEGFLTNHWDWYWKGRHIRIESERETFLENLFWLGEALCEEADEPKPTLLQMMMDKLRQPLHVVTTACLTLDLPAAEVESLVLLLLSNNAPLDSHSYEDILKLSLLRRDSGLFDACRHMEVDSSKELASSGRGPFVSSYYHRFVRGQRTITEVLRNPMNLYDSDMAYYVRMSSHPAIRERAADLAESVPAMSKALDGLAQFQTLQELARDAARDYVIEKYNVTTGIQFEAALKMLEFPEYLKKIIEYDIHTPLYNAFP